MRNVLAVVCASLWTTGVLCAQTPSLLPRPLRFTAEEGGGAFVRERGEPIVFSADSLLPETEALRNVLGEDHPVKKGTSGRIRLLIDKELPFSKSPEAYRIEVTTGGLTIKAPTRHGLYNATSTVYQLTADSDDLPLCTIEDAPAFAWRGYMVDVGRNYQSMEMLKAQIDVMADLKLNVFHFHLTENVAWRLAIKKYPQLTEQKNMTRDQGLFYSEREIRELMAYCEARHILFLPEIDMPGHSEAFKRAMGFDMQSEEGLRTVLEILREVIDTYDFKYFHIGADEVRIVNKAFVPTVTDYLESRGVTVLGWQPGGNCGPSVWRQLWSEGGKKSDSLHSVRLDSRNLYINHMDPLETVPLIYNAKILDVGKGSDLDRGAILCLWNDRRLRRGEDNLTHNAVYPAMMAFAERTWKGEGKIGRYAGIDARPDALEAFREFEDRMFDVRDAFFSELPFPYVRQADIRWSVFGPYPNGGDVSKAFDIEKASASDLLKMKPDTTLIGGTVIYRHFWSPTIKGHFVDVAPNSTFYALRTIESEEERDAYFWISFYHYSTSHHTPTADDGTWNFTRGEAWVNGTLLSPPHWLHSGQPGNLEVPLEDENYNIRRPYRVHLRKGTNTILVKSPIGSFSGPAWYIPMKWMFTFVEAPDGYLY